MRRIVVIQHAEPEGPALVGELAAARGVALDVIHAWRGDAVPRTVGDAAGVLALGGPMAVYQADAYPWMADEQALLRAAVAAGRPVLGVCLGSQLLAAAFGARVEASGRQEIGFHEVRLAASAAADDAIFAGVAARFTPMHWHGDVFALPDGAIALASSRATALQAFRLGGARAWGLLFHLEADAAWVEACTRAFDDELRAHGVDGAALRAEAPAACAAMAPVARAVLGRWLDLTQP